MAALVTGSFVVAAVGALYCLRGVHPEQARMYLRAGTVIGLIASMLVAFPTGDQQAKMVGRHQPVTLAAMEGRFVGGSMSGVALIGQPNVAAQRRIGLTAIWAFARMPHRASYNDYRMRSHS